MKPYFAMLLTSPLAEQIYQKIASEPIVDIHTHLPQQAILGDDSFADLSELWLGHDHYKWRLMRACGVAEEKITGKADPFEKFHAFASCMPLALGNPVHQWAHLELAQVFGLEVELNAETAKEVWQEANKQLESRWSTRALLDFFQVDLVCTTDDPADGLSVHSKLLELKKAQQLRTRVLPTFRPDRFCAPHQPEAFVLAVTQLAETTAERVTSFVDLLAALKKRHQDFHALGCRMSDHGLPFCPAPAQGIPSEEKLEQIFVAACEGRAATEEERELFAAALMQEIAQWNTELGWVMQLHLGPWRNVNSRLFAQVGPDSGLDTIASWDQTSKLVAFFDQLEQRNILPKTIVYHLDGSQAEAICSALQSFQSDVAQGKIQYGPAWWHCDHVPGIQRQLQTAATLSALGTNLGMLTDSRSFTSFVRHDYFRRILASFLADQAKSGEMPANLDTLVLFARRLCGENARQFLQLQ